MPVQLHTLLHTQLILYLREASSTQELHLAQMHPGMQGAQVTGEALVGRNRGPWPEEDTGWGKGSLRLLPQLDCPAAV